MGQTHADARVAGVSLRCIQIITTTEQGATMAGREGHLGGLWRLLWERNLLTSTHGETPASWLDLVVPIYLLCGGAGLLSTSADLWLCWMLIMVGGILLLHALTWEYVYQTRSELLEAHC